MLHLVYNWSQNKLEQLERLRSEIPPPQFCKKLCTRHTFWSCFIRCINMKWIQPELKKLQSGHGMRDGRGTDGRTDRRTDGVKPIYPPTTSLWHPDMRRSCSEAFSLCEELLETEMPMAHCPLCHFYPTFTFLVDMTANLSWQNHGWTLHLEWNVPHAKKCHICIM